MHARGPDLLVETTSIATATACIDSRVREYPLGNGNVVSYLALGLLIEPPAPRDICDDTPISCEGSPPPPQVRLVLDLTVSIRNPKRRTLV